MQLLCEILLVVCFILCFIMCYLWYKVISKKPTIIHLPEPKHHTYEEWFRQCKSRGELNELRLKNAEDKPQPKVCPCIWRSKDCCKICKQEEV